MVTSLLSANVQTRILFDSPQHAECDKSCRIAIDQLQRTQWGKTIQGAKNRKPVLKTGKAFSEQNECPFR